MSKQPIKQIMGLPNLRSVCRVFFLIAMVIESCYLRGQDRVEVDVSGGPKGGARLDHVEVIAYSTHGQVKPMIFVRAGVYYADLNPDVYTIVACDGSGYLPNTTVLKEWKPGSAPRGSIQLPKPGSPVNAKVRIQKVQNKAPAGVTVEYEYPDFCESFTSKGELTNQKTKESDFEIAKLPAPLNYRINIAGLSRPFTARFEAKSNPPKTWIPLKGEDVRGMPEEVLVQFVTPGTEGSLSSGPTKTLGGAGGSSGLYETSVSPTIVIEATFAQRILSMRRLELNVEVPFVIRPAAKVTSDNQLVVKDYRVFFLTPSLHLTLLANRTFYPWLSLGSGLTHFVPGSINALGLSTASSTNKVAFQAGAGVDVWPFRHLGFRTHIRNFYTGRPDLGAPGINLRNTIVVLSGFLIR